MWEICRQIQKWIWTKIQPHTSTIKKWLVVCIGILKFLFYALFTASIIFTILLVITHITLTVGKSPYAIFKYLPDLVLRLCGTDLTTFKADKYSVFVSDMILLIGFFTAVVPIFQMWRSLQKLRKAFKEDYKIDSFPINNEGVDDIAWMLPYYQKGTRITIFAGSFTWLGEKQDLEINQMMKKRICELASDEKLDLVSYKRESDVKRAFEDKSLTPLFNELENCFRYESGLDQVVCTLIQYQPTEWEFLYKGKAYRHTGAYDNYALGDTDKNRVLLHVLSELTKAEHWGKPAVE